MEFSQLCAARSVGCEKMTQRTKDIMRWLENWHHVVFSCKVTSKICRKCKEDGRTEHVRYHDTLDSDYSWAGCYVRTHRRASPLCVVPQDRNSMSKSDINTAMEATLTLCFQDSDLSSIKESYCSRMHFTILHVTKGFLQFMHPVSTSCIDTDWMLVHKLHGLIFSVKQNQNEEKEEKEFWIMC